MTHPVAANTNYRNSTYVVRATRPPGRHLPAYSDLVRGPTGGVELFRTWKDARTRATRLTVERVNPRVKYEVELG